MLKNIYVENVTLQELQQMFSSMLDEKLQSLHIPKEERLKEEYLTRKETSQLLRISLPTLAGWTKQGILKSINLNRRVLYARSEVQRVLGQKGGKNV